MDFLNNAPGFTFTRLHARITEEEGAFTVSVRMLRPQDYVAAINHNKG